MNTAKHTPGPWAYLLGHPVKNYIINAEDQTALATVYDEANARLIAAAPDLKRECDLAADDLDWTIEQLQDNVPLAPWALGLIDGLMVRMKSLEAVLARAEGKGE